MNPGELLQAVERFLAVPDVAAQPTLVQAATDIADMVGWAPGPIDSDGRLTDRLLALLERLRERHAANADDSVAALHDALGNLCDAIARHDLDLAAIDPDDDVLGV